MVPERTVGDKAAHLSENGSLANGGLSNQKARALSAACARRT